MKQFKIASLGQENKTAYNSAGDRFFVPVRFRATAKTGEFMLVVTKHFDKSTELDADGQPVVDDKGQPVLIDKPFDRDEITMIGDLKAVTIARNEDVIMAGIADSIVAQEVANLKKEYSTEDALAAIGG